MKQFSVKVGTREGGWLAGTALGAVRAGITVGVKVGTREGGWLAGIALEFSEIVWDSRK